MIHTLDPANARALLNRSIRRASGFVQTRFSEQKLSVGCCGVEMFEPVHSTAKETKPAENLRKKLGKLSAERAPKAPFGSS